MNIVNCHIRSILLFGAVAVGVWAGGCVGTGEPATGELGVNLVGQGPSGVVYRLRDAVITVTGPGPTHVFHTEDDPNRTSLSANVVAGDYTAELSAGFRLERVQGGESTPITAELISANPVRFTVLAQQRTMVPLRFRVEAEEVDMTQGYDIVLEVDEVPDHGLVVANFFDGNVAVFEPDSNGDAAPIRRFGAARLNGARGVAVVGDEIIVIEQNGNAISVFPLSARSDDPPTRQISGDATGLSVPAGLLVLDGEIYVAQQSGSILVFPLEALGDVAPTRMITGIGQAQHLAIDSGELYVTEAREGLVRVFDAATNGPAVPTRIIAGVGSPSGILIQDGELFVADGEHSVIRVYAKLADGEATPLRVITPIPGLGFIDQLAIFQGEIYTASFGNSVVVVFPVNADGPVSPSRLIGGRNTGLNGPVGLFIF